MAELISRRSALRGTSTCLLAGTLGAYVPGIAAQAASPDHNQATGTMASFPWPPQGRPVKPYVIGHRGAPAYRPELTLASYAKAITDGADFVEIDLMMTKDGELVIRHDIQLDYTTDIAAHPGFASRRRTRTLYGNDVTAWFVDDFTLAELKTLRITDRRAVGGDPGRPEARAYDGWFQILTFDELNDFLDAMESICRRKIGLVIELKMTTHFESVGLSITRKLMETLRTSHYLQHSPIIIQSFEVSPLKILFGDLSGYRNIRFQALVGALQDRPADFRTLGRDESWGQMLASDRIAEVKHFTHWLGLAYSILASGNAASLPAGPSAFVAAMHEASLLISAWTFRPENTFLDKDFRSSGRPMERNAEGSIREMRHYLALGLDGIITDDPGLGRKAVDAAGQVARSAIPL